MKNKPFVIGITGCSGSGKTFFLNSFLKHFQKEEICLISQDDYYIPVGDLTQEENKLHNFDLPNAIDDRQFISDVKQILDGRTIYKKEYTFNNKNSVPQILEIKSAPVVIIEGLFILHYEQLFSLLNLKIFIEAEQTVALQRRIIRDFTERGYNEEDVKYKWNNHVVPSYDSFLLPYRSKADYIIKNNSNIPLHMIAFAEQISQKIRSRLKTT